MQQRIIAAALRCENGLIIAMPRPMRHGDIIAAFGAVAPAQVHSAEQGFLDVEGRFLSRKEAAEIALANGQAPAIRSPYVGLCTEDIPDW